MAKKSREDLVGEKCLDLLRDVSEVVIQAGEGMRRTGDAILACGTRLRELHHLGKLWHEEDQRLNRG